MDLFERFNRMIGTSGECWLWTGARKSHGYGGITVLGRRGRSAHRIGYELYVGPIPEGMTLDHLCRNRMCVRPDHLEPVSNTVNVLRGMSPFAINARATHCVHGHEFTADNILRHPSRPNGRKCLACSIARDKGRPRSGSRAILLGEQRERGRKRSSR
jgi:HNH endonuclease